MPGNLRRVAVIGSARIPFARSNTQYVDAGNPEMLTAALAALVERFGLRGTPLGESPRAR
jgi:acetyl-CoA C-acetyltransferase